MVLNILFLLDTYFINHLNAFYYENDFTYTVP